MIVYAHEISGRIHQKMFRETISRVAGGIWKCFLFTFQPSELISLFTLGIYCFVKQETIKSPNGTVCWVPPQTGTTVNRHFRHPPPCWGLLHIKSAQQPHEVGFASIPLSQIMKLSPGNVE